MNKVIKRSKCETASSTLTVASLIFGSMILAGCATQASNPALQIKPKMDLRHSVGSADGYYSIGRYHHGASRFNEAATAYRHALGLDIRHIRARSALAALLAEQGDPAGAVSLLNEAQDGPARDSQFYSNLGYAHYMNGDYQAATQALEKATSLDTRNVRAWNNFGKVMEKLGQEDRARKMFDRARILAAEKGNDVPARAERSGTVIRLDDANVPSRKEEPPRPIGNSLRTEIRQVVPGVYEVHLGRHQRERAHEIKSSVAEARRPADLKPEKRPSIAGPDVRIEISNGNGVRGMARSVAKLIGAGQFEVHKLSNQPAFNIALTFVEYTKGHEKAASLLAAQIGPSVERKSSDDLGDVAMRIVIGHDRNRLGLIGANATTGTGLIDR